MRAALPEVPRPFWIGLAVVVGIFALAMFVVAVEGIRAKSALVTAADQAEILQEQLTGDHPSEASGTLAELRANTERAHAHTDGPLWAVAARLPLVGDDIKAVQTAAASIDRIADRAMPPVVQI